MQASLLEEAPAPAQARDGRGIAGRGADAVGGQGQVQTRCEPRHDLVAPIGAGREHRAGVELLDRPRERRGQRVRGERLHRLYGQPMWLAQLPGERQRLPRWLAWLHQHEDVHSTPAFWNTSTTAGAAAAPLPSDSARLPWPAGTKSLTSSSLGAGRAGVTSATGLLRARIRPGTDG